MTLSGASASSPLVWVVHLSRPPARHPLDAADRRPASISSLRDKDQLAVSGWWTALCRPRRRTVACRAPDRRQQVEEDGKFVISGNLLEGQAAGQVCSLRHSQPASRRHSRRARPPTSATAETLTVNADGSYRDRRRQRDRRHARPAHLLSPPRCRRNSRSTTTRGAAGRGHRRNPSSTR